MSSPLPPEVYKEYPSKKTSTKNPEPTIELPAWMSIDFIIKNIFPILGILMISGGIGYFFYTGFWDTISKTGRLGLGFIFGITLIIGGYSFSQKLKYFADIIIGGGILTLYISLIYGAQFDFAKEFNTQIIPEGFALLTSFLFCSCICWYSLQRRSRTIVSLGMLGAYLTPFFIGQVGSFESQISFNSFLLYFFAVGVSLFFTSFKMNTQALAGVNTLGLFIGTLGLAGLMGNGFLETSLVSTLICIGILTMHLGFVSINQSKYHQSHLLSTWHYIAPFLWILSILYIFLGNIYYGRDPLIDTSQTIGIGATSFLYFATWYYIEKKEKFPQGVKNTIYGIAVLSLCLLLLEYSSNFGKYIGLTTSAISCVFALIHFLFPKVTREISWILIAYIGLYVNLFQMDSFSGETLIFTNSKLVLIGSLIPFLFHFFLPITSGWNITTLRKLTAWLSLAGIAALLISDAIDYVDIPLSFIIGTIPAGVVTFFALQKKGEHALELGTLSLLFLFAGYLTTFFSFWEKFFPAHKDTFLFNSESLIAGTSLVIGGVLWNWSKAEGRQKHSIFSFSIIVFCSTVLLQWVSYEIVGMYNSFVPYNYDISSDMRGIRAAIISFWWVILAGSLIFLGIKNSDLYTIEKRVGLALLIFTLAKIFLYDLVNIDTNLKILLFIITGSILLGISYVFQRKHNITDSEE